MDERFVTGASGTLSVTLYVDDTAASADEVTVRVTRDGDGAVLTEGTGFVSAASATDATGTYTITLDTQDSLSPITAVWQVTRDDDTFTVSSHAEIVGARLCNVADVRASDTSLTDATKYPAANIWRAIAETEDEFERILGAGLIPRGTTETRWGGGIGLFLSRRPLLGVYELTTGTTNIAASGLSWQWDGSVVRNDGLSFDAITTAWYAYGMQTVPNDLRRAALTRVRHRLNAERSGIPDRATQMVIADGGQFTLATPGKGGSFTGIPDVDAVLARYSMRHPGVA